MSYILEALRKAEQRREQEEPSKVPTFLTGSVPESGRRTRLWPYIVSAVLLLNVGLVVWRLIPRQITPAPPLAETAVKKESALAARTPVKSSRKPAPSTVVRKENQLPVVFVAPSKPLAGSETPPVSQPRVEQPQPSPAARSSAVNELSEPVVNPQTRAGKQRPVASGRLFSLSELPPSVRGALPEFRVSGHAYTPEPQTRVVRINERILQEGQELLPGLKLEEIVQGGVVMSHDGYRFRINIKEN